MTDQIQQSPESLLKESEDRYRALFDNASDLIQSVRPDGTFEFVNRAWHTALGFTEDDLAGMVIWDVIYPEAMQECQTHFMMVMQGTPLTDIRTTFMDKEGRPIPVEGSAQPRFMGDTLVATHAFFRDISERLRTEELETRNRELEMERQARFLEKMAALGKLSAGLSHELNNPAAAARRSAQQLEGTLRKRDVATRELFAHGVTPDDFVHLELLVDECFSRIPFPANAPCSMPAGPRMRSRTGSMTTGWTSRGPTPGCWCRATSPWPGSTPSPPACPTPPSSPPSPGSAPPSPCVSTPMSSPAAPTGFRSWSAQSRATRSGTRRSSRMSISTRAWRTRS